MEIYNIISEQTKRDLEENETKMGQIHKLFIDINTLETNNELITYAIHDVVYLVDLYKILKLNIIKERPKDYFILVEALRYSFMEKRLISNIGDDLVITNMMNNYWISLSTSKDKLKHLNKLFDSLLKDYIDSFDSAKYIFNINYSKSNIHALLKLITYDLILLTYTVNASNSEVVDYKLTKQTNELFDALKLFELNHLIGFIKQFQQFVFLKFK